MKKNLLMAALMVLSVLPMLPQAAHSAVVIAPRRQVLLMHPNRFRRVIVTPRRAVMIRRHGLHRNLLVVPRHRIY